MNIWDSVHRSLDKASREAGRIARMQRLRSQLDKVTRQINTQEGALLHQVMDLFMSGQLTQSELLPLCREIASLRQQLTQAQSELQILHSQGPQSPQPDQVGSQGGNAPPTMGGEIAPTTYAVPPYSASTAYPYQPFDTTVPAIPPPPPGMDLQTLYSQETITNTLPGAADNALTISAQETMLVREGRPIQQPGNEASASVDEGPEQRVESRQRCPQCNAEASPGYYFCQNCGSALLPQQSDYQPTVRASGSTPFYQQGQETILPSSTIGNDRSQRTDLSPASNKEEATTYSVPPPPPPNTASETKDGGH